MNIYSKVSVHIGPMTPLRSTAATEIFVPLSLINIQFHAITTIVLKSLTEKQANLLRFAHSRFPLLKHHPPDIKRFTLKADLAKHNKDHSANFHERRYQTQRPNIENTTQRTSTVRGSSKKHRRARKVGVQIYTCLLIDEIPAVHTPLQPARSALQAQPPTHSRDLEI